MTKNSPILGVTALLILTGGPLHAAMSSGWRGDGSGQYLQATPPLVWSSTSNVVWMTRLPKPSNASPLILGDRVFVCAEPDTLICLSLADGRVLWQKSNALAEILPPDEAAKVKEARAQSAELHAKLKPLKEELKSVDNEIKRQTNNVELSARQATLKTSIREVEGLLGPLGRFADPATHDVNGYSSPTPATDGLRIYALFGTGVAVCFDPSGTRVWGRFIEKPNQGWGHSASPLVSGNRMLCHIVKVSGLDTATGQVLWQTEARHAWGSPVLVRTEETDVAVTAGGDIIRMTDGRLLAGKVGGLEYCAPVTASGVVYFAQNGGKAIRLPAPTGESFKPETLWQTAPKQERYYASPVLHDGLLYAVTQQGDYSIIDAADGRVVCAKKLNLGGTFYPSITLAGSYLYISSDNGKTLVLQPGPEGKELARNSLEPFRSSPVFAGERLYVRTLGGLYCIGK